MDGLSITGINNTAVRLIPAALWLAIIWTAETCVSRPRHNRVRHGVANLSLAAINGALLFFSAGLLSVYVCGRFAHNWFGIASPLVAFFGLDLFGYLWHRANHRFSILWRFHEVHHSDNAMDVTTSGRFHFVELGVGAIIRLPALYVLGVNAWMLLIYETALVAVSMLHHSTIDLGKCDPILRAIIVTSAMHSIHHSRDPIHYEQNFSSILSIWDHLFGTFGTSSGTISHGLKGFDDSNKNSIGSMLAAPFRKRDNIG